MTIVPFLRDGAFEPDDIKAMSMALDDVCKTLNLTEERRPNARSSRSASSRWRGTASVAPRSCATGYSGKLASPMGTARQNGNGHGSSL